MVKLIFCKSFDCNQAFIRLFGYNQKRNPRQRVPLLVRAGLPIMFPVSAALFLGGRPGGGGSYRRGRCGG